MVIQSGKATDIILDNLLWCGLLGMNRTNMYQCVHLWDGVDRRYMFVTFST